MELYQRLGEALSEEEVDALFKEIIDRFGAPPLPALWLCSFSKVRAFAALEGFTGVKIEGATLIAEKKKEGKLERRRWVFSLPRDPKTFEMRLIALLKNEF